LKVTNNTEFAKYAAAIYHLNEGSADVDEDDSGYFSNDLLPEGKKDEVTDEEFLKLLHKNHSLEENDRKH
jgi:hypothetical protein